MNRNGNEVRDVKLESGAVQWEGSLVVRRRFGRIEVNPKLLDFLRSVRLQLTLTVTQKMATAT
jgi:hypothetical protein